VRRHLIETLALAALAAVAGTIVNLARSDRLPARLPAGYYQVESKARAILLPTARGMFRSGKAIFLDARSADEFEAGRIQGAFSIPVEEWSFLYDALAPWIEGSSVVVYSSETTVSRADDLARALASRGHAGQLFVYVGGVAEWQKSGMPVESGPAPSLDPGADQGDAW
jgi:rhodanese-related sulfurtransferase